MAQSQRLLLLLHDGSWDRIFQAASCAATASSTGWTVDVVLYFEALRKWLDGRVDEVSGGAVSVEAVEERISRPPSALFDFARGQGNTRMLACTASLGLLGIDPDEAAGRVDELVGWPTVTALMERAQHVLYL